MEWIGIPLQGIVSSRYPLDQELIIITNEIKTTQNNAIVICRHFVQGRQCPYGARCWFRHNFKRRCKFDLYGCNDKNCRYTHYNNRLNFNYNNINNLVLNTNNYNNNKLNIDNNQQLIGGFNNNNNLNSNIHRNINGNFIANLIQSPLNNNNILPINNNDIVNNNNNIETESKHDVGNINTQDNGNINHFNNKLNTLETVNTDHNGLINNINDNNGNVGDVIDIITESKQSEISGLVTDVSDDTGKVKPTLSALPEWDDNDGINDKNENDESANCCALSLHTGDSANNSNNSNNSNIEDSNSIDTNDSDSIATDDSDTDDDSNKSNTDGDSNSNSDSNNDDTNNYEYKQIFDCAFCKITLSADKTCLVCQECKPFDIDIQNEHSQISFSSSSEKTNVVYCDTCRKGNDMSYQIACTKCATNNFGKINSNDKCDNTSTQPTITQIKETLKECGLTMDPSTTKLMEQLQKTNH